MRMRGRKPIFTYRDTWNISEVFVTIIKEGVKKFKDIEDEWRGYLPEFNNFEEWQEVLEFICEALDAKEPEYDGRYTGEEGHGDRTEDGLYEWRMKPTDKAGWERSRQEFREYHWARQKAMELFGRYVFNMWW